MTPRELLNKNRIYLNSYEVGKHVSTCPKCSHGRKLVNQKLKCLGVKIDEKGATWHCNHCGDSGPRKGNGQSGEFAATYDYRDASGKVRFQKVRKLPGSKPRFFMRRPDGRGGWINDTKGVDTSLLYRIDEVKEAVPLGRRIAVVEGEKDADKLWAIGIPATCNAHGASEVGKKPKWTEKHSAQLRGADIVVFNDNDAPGYAHADVACRLSYGVAARVCRLDLAPHWPGMPEGKDVSDWLAAGHTRKQLDTLIETAKPWESSDDNEPPRCSEGGVEAEDLPELIIDGSNLTATAKQLAKLFAQRRRFLFNGHEPVEIVAETGMPRAIAVTNEAVRVFAHEICTPVKIVKGKTIRTTLSKDIAGLYLRGLQGRWGLKPFNGITTAPSSRATVRSAPVPVTMKQPAYGAKTSPMFTSRRSRPGNKPRLLLMRCGVSSAPSHSQMQR
jgi:hypothetical protein